MKLAKKDYIWSYIGVILSLTTNIILTPFIMFFLDSDSFGFWGIFQSLAAITVLFDFGFTTTFSRNINYSWNGAEKLEKIGVRYSNKNEPNFELMKSTMEVCKKIFLILSIFALILMLSIGTWYIHTLSNKSELNNFVPIISWLIYCAAIFLNLYYGYYSSFLRGVGAISDANIAIVIAKFIQIITTIAFLLVGLGLIGISLSYLAFGFIFRIIAKNRFYNYKGIGEGLDDIKCNYTKYELKSIFLTVWYSAWREGLISLSNYLSNQACTVICSLYLPLSETGAYSLAVQLSMAVSQISAVMYTANQPVLQSAYIRNEKVKIKNTMSLIIFSFVILNIVGLSAVVFIGLPLLNIIKPEIVLGCGEMFAIGLYQFMLKFRNCYTSYFSCTNRIIYVKSFLVSSIICVILAFVLMGTFGYGIWGLIISQIISQGIFNFWFWMFKAHSELNLSFIKTIKIGYSGLNNLVLSFFRKGK